MKTKTRPSSKAYFLPALAAGTVLASAVGLATSMGNGVDENATASVICLFLSVAVLYVSVHNILTCRRAEDLDKVDIFLKCTPGRSEEKARPKTKFKLPNH